MRVLSGIQPSGKLHLGNYLGAMKQHLEMQHEHECFFFIANYHTLTTIQDRERLLQLSDSRASALALAVIPALASPELALCLQGGSKWRVCRRIDGLQGLLIHQRRRNKTWAPGPERAR